MNRKILLGTGLVSLILGGIIVGGFGLVSGGPIKGDDSEAGRYRLFQATVQVQNELTNKVKPTLLVFLLYDTHDHLGHAT